jgi:DNA repair protein RecO (recombination protein O)
LLYSRKRISIFFSEGVYSAKNKKKAYLAPLNELLITVVDKPKTSDLLLISKIECLENLLEEYDVKISTLAFLFRIFYTKFLETNKPIIYFIKK